MLGEDGPLDRPQDLEDVLRLYSLAELRLAPSALARAERTDVVHLRIRARRVPGWVLIPARASRPGYFKKPS